MTTPPHQLPVAAWLTNDGRVATNETKLSGMARVSQENFNEPLCKVSDALAAIEEARRTPLSKEELTTLAYRLTYRYKERANRDVSYTFTPGGRLFGWLNVLKKDQSR